MTVFTSWRSVLDASRAVSVFPSAIIPSFPSAACFQARREQPQDESLNAPARGRSFRSHARKNFMERLVLQLQTRRFLFGNIRPEHEIPNFSGHGGRSEPHRFMFELRRPPILRGERALERDCFAVALDRTGEPRTDESSAPSRADTEFSAARHRLSRTAEVCRLDAGPFC